MARERLGACFHTFVFAAYPAILVVGANAGVVPLDVMAVARCVAISSVVVAGLLVILRRPIPELSNRAAYLSFVLIGFSLYPILDITSTRASVAVAYVLATGAAAALIVRPWQSRVRKSTALNLAACALLAANLYGARHSIGGEARWRPAADGLITEAASSGSAPAVRPLRDVYYIVLDAFGRADVLSDLYQLDLGWFVDALQSRGFFVSNASRSNYSQTFLSLGSSLNLNYLDAVAGRIGDAGDRRPLEYLIQHNALMKLARRAGYRVIAIGSDYAATERFEDVDECLCEQYGLSETELAAISLTPLRSLPLDRWTYDAHRRKVEASFRHLASAANERGPKLVFAHVLSPHPPFVFGPRGDRGPNPSHFFSFQDGNHYPGSRAEYIAGYRDQATFVAGHVLELIDAILRQPGPSPVIVLHGDHGPGAMWNWDDLDAANARERMDIFFAYHFPGEPRALPSNISPANGVRMLSNRYLGTALPTLPDLSFASGWQHPYQFVPIRPDGTHEPQLVRRGAE